MTGDVTIHHYMSNTMKSLNLPRRPTNDENKHRTCANALKMRIDMNGVAMHASTTGDMQGCVSTWPMDL